MTENLQYQVVRKYPDFEVRRYPDYTLVQYQAVGEFMDVGYQGFRPLFNFITGSNARAQNIPMTAPVIQESKDASTHLVSFVMPADMKPEDVPAPTNTRVSLKHVAGHDAAAISYSGSWSVDRLRAKSDQLAAALKREGIASTGNFYFARFNPPWMPPFLKHNEVLIALEGKAA